MRVLLTANASYSPPKGGSTRSNLIWLAHLAQSGHTCRVICPTDNEAPDFAHINTDRVEIRAYRELSRRAELLQQAIAEFRPDWVLVSSEDVAHVLLRAAYASAPDRLVYLAHTPQWYPFGPASWHPDPQATEIVRQCTAVVAIAHTTAEYIRQHTGADATVIHPPVYGGPPWPRFGSFDSGYVLTINPSVVKGISIFLELARQFPEVEFAGLAGWGTTSADRERMRLLPNVRVLETVAGIDEVLSGARLLLMPSLWFEGFGLIAMEAMLRGLPVIASNSGGLAEAKAGTGFLIPVNPIEKFEAEFDETHMPRPVELPQDIRPWADALRTLLSDRAIYEAESERSRERAVTFVSGLHAGELEHLLKNLRPRTMRVLLAHNSLYYPSHGGGDKSNRLLMEALAARGHQVRVVSRVEVFGAADADKLMQELQSRSVPAAVNAEGAICFELNGVSVETVAYQSNLRPYFSRRVETFDPDIILTSTDDPGQLLFDLAVKSSRARVVYLIRATIAVPFGPDSSAPNAAKTEALKQADGAVGVSEYVADYARRFGGLEAIHVPISLLESGTRFPCVGHFDSPYVAMVNPCAVKGISIFLELADRMPDVRFAAVPTWGTTAEDYQALTNRPNISVLPPVDNIDDLLKQTKVLLVPSVWAEARSRIVPEAMSRGVPVISSDAGGLPEAHLGVDYVLPVNLIQHYQPSLDMNLVPVADVPPQDIGPWERALRRLTSDREHWGDISRRSREAALEYAENLSVEPFEGFLRDVLRKPRRAPQRSGLSEEKRRLLALRLRQRTAGVSAGEGLFLGWQNVRPGDLALLCLPWAGSGTSLARRLREPLSGSAVPVGVRLPGHETRIAEAPFEAMEDLVPALGEALASHLDSHPLAVFGHSMGAGIAFELARWLRARKLPMPLGLIVSGARAPQLRSERLSDPDPTDEQLQEKLRSLNGAPQNPGLMAALMPVLRADTRLYRRYVYEPGDPLGIPIFAYGGRTDPQVTPEHIALWREQTTANFRQRIFEGGHFYFETDFTGFISALRDDIQAFSSQPD